MNRNLCALLLLLLSTVFFVSAGVASEKLQPAPSQSQVEPPMTVAIVRSNYFDCEPVCPQWIAAEGRITKDTPSAFKQVLKSIGKTQLPIILNSPGGDVNAAISIGKMIRARKLDVAIGRTKYSGCGANEKDCKLPKEQRGVYRGSVEHQFAYCNSACPYMLAAGVRRIASSGVLIGVHQISTTVVEEKIYYRETYRIVNGKKTVTSRKVVKRKPVKSYVTTKTRKSLRRTLASYLSSMGVDPGLMELYEKAPPSSLYWMSLEDMDRTKLTTNHIAAASVVSASGCRLDPPPGYCVRSPLTTNP